MTMPSQTTEAQTEIPATPVLDVQFVNHGSIFMVTPLTDAAKAWIDENVETEGWQWLGNSLSVDHRLAENLHNGMCADGLEVG